MTLGPCLGAFLFEAGGFRLPFVAVGSAGIAVRRRQKDVSEVFFGK